jgi:hypothetical protein
MALVLGVAALSITACEEFLLPSDLPGKLRTVVLISDASNSLPIHILTQEESFDESNRLEPGQRRETMVRIPDSRRLEFRAGRNGNVIVTVTCEATVTAADGFVRWIDGRLDCDNGLQNT